MEKDYQQGKIYMIINLLTGLVYIGSTTLVLKKRWQIHYQAINITIKKGRPLYKAIAECGKESFVVILLEHYPCENEETLLIRETYWQDKFDSRNPDYGYNVFRAYSSLDITKQTDQEYNRRFREKNPDYQREWRSKNPDTNRQKGTEKMREWREKNREHYNRYMRERRQRLAAKNNL
jgi:group I intron endonuclease